MMQERLKWMILMLQSIERCVIGSIGGPPRGIAWLIALRLVDSPEWSDSERQRYHRSPGGTRERDDAAHFLAIGGTHPGRGRMRSATERSNQPSQCQ